MTTQQTTRQQDLLDATGSTIDVLASYRRDVYRLNGYQPSPLVDRLDKVMAELRSLRVVLPAIDRKP